MGRTEFVILSVFVLLLVTGLVLGIRQAARQREATSKYVASRGWSLLTGEYGLLGELLEEALPRNRWSLNPVIQAERGPEAVYLFGYQASKSDSGHACLAQIAGDPGRAPVTLTTRIPGFGAMVGNRLDVGTAEFLKQFFVSCTNSGVAEKTVSPQLQRILLEHSADPGWYLEVTITARAVLVSSSWAKKEPEWDHIIQLAKRLRTAIRPSGGEI